MDTQVQVTPLIKFKRALAPNQRDFLVLIDGEHRATFRSRRRFHQAGYDCHTPNGDALWNRKLGYIEHVQENFEEIIRRLLPSIPSLAQIERDRLIEQAWRENREHDSQVAAHRNQVHNDVIRTALGLYLRLSVISAEHREMAETILKRHI